MNLVPLRLIWPKFRELEAVWLSNLMAMLFGKNASRLDRMFKETGHQNAYFHYLFKRACLTEEKKCREICERNALS
jgi:hypothetical protein